MLYFEMHWSGHEVNFLLFHNCLRCSGNCVNVKLKALYEFSLCRMSVYHAIENLYDEPRSIFSDVIISTALLRTTNLLI